MKSAQAKQFNSWRILLLIGCIHVLLWTVACVLTRHNIPFDTAESIAWGKQWQLGYDKHPPLAAWLSALITDLGKNVEWPVYLLSQLSVLGCFIGVWLLAKQFLEDKAALISVLLLEGIYYYNIAATQFNPNVLMLSTWAFTVFFCYKALRDQKNYDWLLTGIWAGLSILAKYQSILILISLSLLLVTKTGRRSFRTTGFYLAICIFILICLPNVIWLWQNDFITFSYVTNRVNIHNHHGVDIHSLTKHFIFAWQFSIEQIGAILPLFILYLPFIKCVKSPFLHNDRFATQFISVINFCPLGLTLCFSIIKGAWLNALWGYPFFSWLGIALFFYFKPIITKKHLRAFLILFCCIFSTMLLIRSCYLVWGPHITHKTNSAHFPGPAIARVLTQEWQNTYHRPLAIVAGYHALAENVTVYSNDHPIPYFQWSILHGSWVTLSLLHREGALFIWDASTSPHLPLIIQKRFPEAREMPIHLFNKETSATVDPMKIGIAFLPPENHVTPQAFAMNDINWKKD